MGEQKRILIIAFDFPPQIGGVSTYSKEIAQSFFDQGYEVLVLTKDRGPHDSYPFQVVTIPLPNSGLLSVAKMTLAIRQWVKQFKPTFIFNSLWLPDATSTYLALKSLNSNIPYSIVLHGMEILPHSLKGKLRSQLVFFKKEVFKKAKFCICISEFTKRIAQEQNLVSNKNLIVINNGVNPKIFQDEHNSKHKFPQLLTVARLMPHKGIDQAIMSLPPVVKLFPTLTYKIIGSGPDKERLQSLTKKLKLEHHVEFLGTVPMESLSQHYSEADLFLLLSRQINHQVEGFGLVILEAALAKTPSLGGKSGGIPDAINDGTTGWLVDSEQTSDISKKLIDILSDPEKLKIVSQAAYDFTLKERTWEKVTKKIATQMSEA